MLPRPASTVLNLPSFALIFGIHVIVNRAYRIAQKRKQSDDYRYHYLSYKIALLGDIEWAIARLVFTAAVRVKLHLVVAAQSF